MTNAAFYFAGQNYRTAGDMMVGRQSASGGLLKGFIRHGGAETLCGYVDGPATAREFHDFAEAAGVPAAKRRTYLPLQMPELGAVGTLFRPGPALGPPAWARRQFDARAFSLTGITHTVSDTLALDALGELLIAPLEPWDALVCTSESVKAVVGHVLADWAAYLEARFGSRPPLPRLPIIPLGVDADAVAQRAENPETRADLRQRMSIDDEDVALLYAGRLDHVEKANPIPMLLAAERAAKATPTKLHLIQAGQAATPELATAYKTAATTLAPSVSHHFVDGAMTELYEGVWAAADVFISLSDNIQESFGLTPIEAMAAGLPCVVSDWDGYRESVIDGETGFTVATAVPPPGAGRELAYYYGSGFAGHAAFAGAASQSTAVDVGAAAEALGKLIADADLRARMGAAGRAHAQSVYDWRHVVQAHQALWAELADVRATGTSSAAATWPLRPDPFEAFKAHPTHHIAGAAEIAANPDVGPEAVKALRGAELAAPVGAMLMDAKAAAALYARIAEASPVTVATLAAGMDTADQVPLHLTLGWLAKMGFVTISGGGTAKTAFPFAGSSSWKGLAGD